MKDSSFNPTGGSHLFASHRLQWSTSYSCLFLKPLAKHIVNGDICGGNYDDMEPSMVNTQLANKQVVIRFYLSPESPHIGPAFVRPCKWDITHTHHGLVHHRVQIVLVRRQYSCAYQNFAHRKPAQGASSNRIIISINETGSVFYIYHDEAH